MTEPQLVSGPEYHEQHDAKYAVFTVQTANAHTAVELRKRLGDTEGLGAVVIDAAEANSSLDRMAVTSFQNSMAWIARYMEEAGIDYAFTFGGVNAMLIDSSRPYLGDARFDTLEQAAAYVVSKQG